MNYKQNKTSLTAANGQLDGLGYQELSDEEMEVITGGNLIGNNFQVIGIASQNSAVDIGGNNGNTAATAQAELDALNISISSNAIISPNAIILA